MARAVVLRADARALPLPDDSVDLIVTSPPYYALRDYEDDGESLPGQIGKEDTPQEYIANLVDCTAEWMRVLKPSGSMFVNLGDKFVADNRGSGVDVKRGKARGEDRPPPAKRVKEDLYGGITDELDALLEESLL